jgi:hypothetical protein
MVKGQMNPSSQPARAQTLAGIFTEGVGITLPEKIALIAAACCVCGYLLFRVGLEIFYAANPDKRPIKRKRRK